MFAPLYMLFNITNHFENLLDEFSCTRNVLKQSSRVGYSSAVIMVTGHFGPKTFWYQRFGSEYPDQVGIGAEMSLDTSAEVSPATSALVLKCPHTSDSFELRQFGPI